MSEERSPDERAASEKLEEAIREWYRVTYGEDQITVGWYLISDMVSVKGGPEDGVIVTTCSDGLSIVSQMGLLRYAELLLAEGVRRGSYGEEEE